MTCVHPHAAAPTGPRGRFIFVYFLPRHASCTSRSRSAAMPCGPCMGVGIFTYVRSAVAARVCHTDSTRLYRYTCTRPDISESRERQQSQSESRGLLSWWHGHSTGRPKTTRRALTARMQTVGPDALSAPGKCHRVRGSRAPHRAISARECPSCRAHAGWVACGGESGTEARARAAARATVMATAVMRALRAAP